MFYLSANSAKDSELKATDHYAAKLWESMNWKTSEVRLQCLKKDILAKKENMERCNDYHESGDRLKAKSNVQQFPR